MMHTQLEECIIARCYTIWCREGRDGRAEDFLDRAKYEIERDLRLALEGETTDFVPPHLTISQRPIRRAA